jgi:hypothetical protein
LGIKDFDDLPTIVDFSFFDYIAIFKVFGDGIDKPVPGRFTVFFSGARQSFGKPFLRLALRGGFCRLTGRTSAGIGLGFIVPKTDVPNSAGTGIPSIEAIGITGN